MNKKSNSVARDPQKLIELAENYLLDGARHTAVLYLRLAINRIEEQIEARNHLMGAGPMPKPAKWTRREGEIIRRMKAKNA